MSWTCPNCDRELPWKEYRHYCARVSLDSLFEGRAPELVLAFDKILAEVADWPDVLIGVTPNCIVFTRRVGFLIIRPMKKKLALDEDKRRLDARYYYYPHGPLARVELGDQHNVVQGTDYTYTLQAGNG